MSKQKEYDESWSPQWKYMINEERKAKYLAQKTERELEKEAQLKERIATRNALEEARESMKKPSAGPAGGKTTDEIVEMIRAEKLKREQENANTEQESE